MSQVDYIHFFSNIVWTIILLCVFYICICVFYVQNIYKVLRLRKLFLHEIYFIITSKLYCWLTLSKVIIKLYNNFKNYYVKVLSNLLKKRKNVFKIICI